MREFRRSVLIATYLTLSLWASFALESKETDAVYIWLGFLLLGGGVWWVIDTVTGEAAYREYKRARRVEENQAALRARRERAKRQMAERYERESSDDN